jgi:hypothetical protein
MITTRKASAEMSVFEKDTLVKGRPARIRCVEIEGQTFEIKRGLASVIRLEEEWYDDLRDPTRVIAALRRESRAPADILTFWQRLPDVEPRHPYHMEWDELAVLPIRSYEEWWNHRIKSRVRSLIRKTEKDGVVVRETSFDEAFVQGMTAIFNESPVRQGRRFWHYGKDVETVGRQFSRYVHRERMLAAYYRGEMIGAMMLAETGPFALTGQLISSLRHRDKATNNALIAKAVEVCARNGLGDLVYLFWGDDSLAEFKRRCGFECIKVPRYYVPITMRGRLAMRWGIHRGVRAGIPRSIRVSLKQMRKRWLDVAVGSAHREGEGAVVRTNATETAG